MSQDQHYVPQAYLKRFLNSNDKVFRLPKQISKPPTQVKEFSPAATGYLPNFYVVKDEIQLLKRGLEDVNHIEKHLAAHQDAQCSKLLDQLVNARALPIKDAFESLLLILSFKERNPVLRNDLADKAIAREVYESNFYKLEVKFRELRATSFSHLTDKEFDDHLADTKTQMYARIEHENFATNAHNEHLLSFFDSGDTLVHHIARALLDWKWFLYEVPASTPFITSDNPGFTTDRMAQPHNLGFSEAVGFCFPLSPIHCLAIVNEFDREPAPSAEYKRIHRLIPEAEWITIVNKSTYVISYKFIYSSNQTPLISTWHDLHPGFK